ncbi:telomere-associated protein RIF1 isoform X2 [Austrofundulus limnaeus]|uniref:Telomere-associated protein RIF1 isoform X2 n=1 Tax=Austrofundulus limnaeus TaxID=52670 RepID=A0A2I4C9I9_AUSLI|nr:PREDICTED: telomere-associated protein RIF1 isoform X2 [Austrofundulus limnaeus]
MMATAGPSSMSSFLPLLGTLEDSTARQSEQIDAYLTIANRLSGEEGRQFLPAVEKDFSRFGKAMLVHLTSPCAELCQAALQALGFCVYHSHVVAGVSEVFVAQILSTVCLLVVKSTDKNTCTRALWVISKQNFPAYTVAKSVPTILSALESVWNREDIQSAVMEHEALNVVIRMLEQVPTQMGDRAVTWAKLVVPLVVHSASKVRLRAAAALEMGIPLLLARQTEVAAVVEPMMSSKLIPELQKLFMSKNETNVLKLWPLFVKLLGKLLHRGGPFINSLLHLEELGFRSSSPTIKKIAFIAWKSLIDNFALNPDILSSAKRIKLLMQPLISIHVRAEALLLTKVEVWWYLVVQLGSNLFSNFDQVSVPLLQSSIGSDFSVQTAAPRSISQNGAVTPSTPKSGNSSINSSAISPRMSLNSSMHVTTSFPSIQLLGLEMLLHYLQGPEVVASATKNNLILNLEPLKHPLFSGAASFLKHAAVLISSIKDGFIIIGKEAPESLLVTIWTSLVQFVNLTVESGSKKDRQGCEVLTLMLQALQSIVISEGLTADRVLILFEVTVKGLSQRVLGSASYQVGKMDVLNGTPSLFLILLLFNSSMLPSYVEAEKFFQCLQTLVSCSLLGPTSPLTFSESVLGTICHSAESLQSKEKLWRMWSLIVVPLTDTISQSNEVNQGDALEHNFNAIYCALMFPITHLLCDNVFPQASQKSMLSSWSKLYKVFACCSALVVTAGENICCEELCAKIKTAVDREVLTIPSTLNFVASILHVMVECVDFSPYTPNFQQQIKSPHTPMNWTQKQNKALGNMSTFHSLLVQCLQVYLEAPEAFSESTGLALISVLSTLFNNLVLFNVVKEALNLLIQPLVLLYKQAEMPRFTSHLLEKLEKLLNEILSCLQTCSALAYNDELLALLSPLLCVLFLHKNKHLRSSVTQFWNATFTNAVNLLYPEEIRPVLSQVKQRIPVILPGFEVVNIPEEPSGTYSNESSQMETHLSGMPVSSSGKKDSLLDNLTEINAKGFFNMSKPISTKLDLGSPKPPCKKVLEEEASMGFVFIPPETKERVLTEHQKEVKRTKRVDIPAMYNNLDASLDTTVFTQYTQSQKDCLMDKVPTEKDDIKEVTEENLQEDEQMNRVVKVLNKQTEANTTSKPVEEMIENRPQEGIFPDFINVSIENYTNCDERAEDVDMESKDETNADTSTSPDLVSGTPQKPNSRRQTFITLEKYSEGKSATPTSMSLFTGPLEKNSNSPDHSNNDPVSTEASLMCTSPNFQDYPQREKISPQCCMSESPQRPKDSKTKSAPVRLIERLPGDSIDKNIIPDTQTGCNESTTVADEIKPSSQEKESESVLNGSQSSLTQMSPDEPKPPKSHRVRSQLLGEDSGEHRARNVQFKHKHFGEDLKSESPNTTPSRPHTRSKQAAEENRGKDRLRSWSQSKMRNLNQTNSQERHRKKIKLFSTSGNFFDNPQIKRNVSSLESSQTISTPKNLSSPESQKRHGRSRRTSKQIEDEGEKNKEESSQAVLDCLNLKNEQEADSQTNFQEPIFFPQTDGKIHDPEVKTEKDENQKEESEADLSSRQWEGQVLEKVDFHEATTPANEYQDKTNILESDEMKKNKCKTNLEENLSQENNLKRRCTQSESLSEAVEYKDKDDRKISIRPRRSTQTTHAVTQAEAETGCRTRRSKGSASSPSFTPDGSQSLEFSGSESSQGRGKYSRQRTSAASLKSTESESSEIQKNSPIPKRRGRKSKASLRSPLTFNSVEETRDLAKKCASQKTNIQTFGANMNLESPETQNVLISEQVRNNIKGQGGTESLMVTKMQAVHTVSTVGLKKTESGDTKQGTKSHGNAEQTSKTDGGSSSSQGRDIFEPVGLGSKQTENTCFSADNTMLPLNEKLRVTDLFEKNVEELPPENKVKESNSGRHDFSNTPEPAGQQQRDVKENEKQFISNLPSERRAEKDICPAEVDDVCKSTAMENKEQTNSTNMECSDVGLSNCNPLEPSESTIQDSPVKQKELEAVTEPDDGQSPSSGQAKGTWSPSASPSTSILKKGQKRLMEVEVTSPPVKSRRVSFANPIKQQEMGGDMDRRTAVRTSSPRRSNVSIIPQPKHVTTPVKSMSPRNLHSPSNKCSKKCLRKGRGGDELKSFDETELMASEIEDMVPPNQDKDKTTAGETLSTELMDESFPPNVDSKATQTPDGAEEPLPSVVEALSCRMMPLELSHCTPQQLVQMHYQLGGMMKCLVTELQTRVCHDGGKP